MKTIKLTEKEMDYIRQLLYWDNNWIFELEDGLSIGEKLCDVDKNRKKQNKSLRKKFECENQAG